MPDMTIHPDGTVHLTRAELAAIHRDYKGRDETDGRWQVLVNDGARGTVLVLVTIVPPTPDPRT